MIAQEPQINRIDPRHWANLMDLFQAEQKPKGSIALVLTRQGQAVKTIHSERGVLLGYRPPKNGSLRKIRKDIGADTLGMCELDAIARIFDATQRAMPYDADLAQQFISMFNAGFATAQELIKWSPRPPLRLRKLSYRRGQKILDWLLPDGRSLLFVVVDQKEVFTSLIIGKQNGDLSGLTTLQAVDDSGFDPARWADQAKALTDKVGKIYGPVHAGLFLTKRTFDEMKSGRRPIRFLREAQKRGTVVIKPYPLKWRLILALASWLRK